ncbi:MAG: hypothetical protein R2860_06545 [Desulfobacterales bacterium]
MTPEKRDAEIEKIKQTEGDFITVDFTLPAAVNDNADFYCRHTLPLSWAPLAATGPGLSQTVREILGFRSSRTQYGQTDH